MSVINVLHVVSNISIRSGVMSVLMNYYRNMDTAKVQFGFLYFDERQNTYEEEIKRLGGEVFKVARVTKLNAFYQNLNAFCKEHYGQYQILHIHDLFMTGFLAGMKKKAGMEKMIIHSHATKFSDHKLGAIRNRIFAQANRFIPDYYFACSKMAGRAAFGKKFDKVGIVINNAIHTDKFFPDKRSAQAVKRELGLEGKFVIGHIGNFTPQKNHFFLINIFQRVLQKNQNAVLVLVGDGNLKDAVLEECKKKKIEENVLYLGIRSDVNRIVHCFDKFLLPSVYEGLGIVLIEAQSAGIPCVFSDVIPEEANILKQSNKILRLRDSVDKWADAVLEPVEPELGSVTQKIVEAGYCIQTEASKLQKKYEDIWMGKPL